MGLQTPRLTVSLQGQPVAVNAVTMRGEIPTELAGPETGGRGIAEGTAEVDWAPAGMVARSDHPWVEGWSKKPGAALTVDLDLGDAGPWRVFTGEVYQSSTVFGETVSSTAHDAMESLKRPVTIRPIAHSMPPFEQGGAYLRPGVQSTWLTNEVLSQCNLWTHTPRLVGCVAMASNAGSLYPSVGKLTLASRYQDTDNPPTWSSISWGDTHGVGALHPWQIIETVPDAQSRRWMLTLDIPPLPLDPNDEDWYSQVTGSSEDDGFGIRGFENTLRAYYLIGGVRTYFATIPRTAATGRVVVMTTDTGVRAYHPEDPLGVEATVTIPGMVSSVGQVRTQGRGVIGAVQVVRPIPGTMIPSQVVTAPRTASIHRAQFQFRSMAATPPIINERGIDVLMEQGQAEMLAMWVNERGVFEAVTPSLLDNAPVAHVITDDPDDGNITLTSPRVALHALTAEITATGPYHAVEVQSRWPVAQIRRYPTLLLWRGTRQTLSSGDDLDEFIHPDGDVDWLHVDTNLRYAGSETGGDQHYNRRIGSWVGGHLVDSNGDPAGWVTSPQMLVGINYVDARTWRLTGQVQSLPSGQEISTLPSPASAGLWPSRMEDALPEIRGMGRITWSDEVHASTITLGPEWAPAYTVDVGWWVQNGIHKVDIADRHAARLATPQPVVRNLRTNLAPVKLGARVRIRVRTVADITVEAVVVGRAINVLEGSMDLTVRVISAVNHSLTFGQLAKIPNPTIDDIEGAA